VNEKGVGTLGSLRSNVRLGIAALVLSVFVCAGHTAAQGYNAGSIGTDVSWPNCRASAAGDNAFGIVGVTGGLDFKPNPCMYLEKNLVF